MQIAGVIGRGGLSIAASEITVHIADYLILTPLDEEWRETAKILCRQPIEKAVGLITYYLWPHQWIRDFEKRAYLIAGASLGQSGETSAGLFTEKATELWSPKHVILLGIAGSLEDELQLGDVIVPYHIFGYETAKLTDERRNFPVKFRPSVHQVSALLWDRVRALRNSPKAYSQWQNECFAVGRSDAMIGQQISQPPELHVQESDGMASGNYVVASKNFARYLKTDIDHRLRAVEMEAHGLFNALHRNARRVDGLMVRGISDRADMAKNRLERTSKGAWRRYAIGNAARLIAILLDRRPSEVVSPPVNIDLNVSSNSFFLCADAGISLTERNAQNLAFPAVISRRTPSPEVLLRVQSSVRGPLTAPMKAKCLISSDVWRQEAESRTGSERGTFEFIIPRSKTGYQVALFLSISPPPAAEIQVHVVDEFGRKTRQTLELS